jgi:hypothetical protein
VASPMRWVGGQWELIGAWWLEGDAAGRTLRLMTSGAGGR